jgi:4-amino-4-deoxy-L-arabinose transferase-like glycosyltransferase
MQPRINHQPSDRDKAPWKAVALFALLAIWLFSGIIGRGPWKPDEPIYLGVLHSMLASGGDAWWSPQVAGVIVDGELPFLHWLNAFIAYVPNLILPLHEAVRVSAVLWAALAIAAVALACRRWSGGHISYLAAILVIGCLGVYDRVHSYVPDVTVFAAIAIGLYATAELAHSARRATILLALAIVVAFMARSALGYLLVAMPALLLAFAPVYSMHRVALIRAVVLATVLCGLLLIAFAMRAPLAWSAWVESGAGLFFEDPTRFTPTYYLVTLLWFAWPLWPIAAWLVSLRVRGFAGGWQRGEFIAPLIFLIVGIVVLIVLAEPRTVYCLFFVPPLAVLAAFGVDTIRRTWYAMIDWFGILVLGIATIGLVLVSTGLYFGWPASVSKWILRFVPQYDVTQVPWLGYVMALVGFIICVALIQPAHQHSRRALINWAGCVTFAWVVAQALLISPADHVTSYRGAFAALDKSWPKTGCVESIELSTSQAAMLNYFYQRTTQPIDELADAQCPFLLLQRWRNEPAAPPSDQYTLRVKTARPGDSSESYELYDRNSAAVAAKATP